MQYYIRNTITIVTRKTEKMHILIVHTNQLIRMDYENMHLFRLSRHDRNRISDIVLHYYRIHVPDMPELKSFQVMRELFS